MKGYKQTDSFVNGCKQLEKQEKIKQLDRQIKNLDEHIYEQKKQTDSQINRQSDRCESVWYLDSLETQESTCLCTSVFRLQYLHCSHNQDQIPAEYKKYIPAIYEI